MENNQYITYEQLINILDQKISGEIHKTQNEINKNNRLIRISNLKLGNKISIALTFSTFAVLGACIGKPIHDLIKTLELYDGYNWMGGLMATSLVMAPIQSVIDKIPNAVDSKFTKLGFTLKRENIEHYGNLKIENKQYSNLTLEDAVYQIIFTPNQQTVLYNRNDIDRFLNLLERFSILTIGYHITNSTCDILEDIHDTDTINQINSTSEQYFKYTADLLNNSKQECRNAFVNPLRTYFKQYSNPRYKQNIFKSKINRDGLPYKDLLLKIINKLNKELRKIKKKLTNYPNQSDEYYLCLEDKAIIEKKLFNIKNWIYVYNDFVRDEEKDMHVSSSLCETIDELLEYYDISTITLGLFGKCLDILQNGDERSYPFINQYSTELINNLYATYQQNKLGIQEFCTSQYHDSFSTIMERKHSL